MSCGLMDFSPPLHGAGVELEFFIIPISTGFCNRTLLNDYSCYFRDIISDEKDVDGNIIKFSNLKCTISFEYSYSIVEFSFPPEENMIILHQKIYSEINRFKSFVHKGGGELVATGYLPLEDHQIEIVKSPYYQMIYRYHEGNKSIAKICSCQTHIDYERDCLIKTINLFNQISWSNSILFSNSEYDGYRCYRDVIWEKSSHGREGTFVGVSRLFRDDSDFLMHEMKRPIFFVYRNGGVFSFAPIRFDEYLNKKYIVAMNFAGDSIIIIPQIDDMQYLRSYSNVAFTRRRTIEIRSDCQQSYERMLLPVVYNWGVRLCYNEIEQLLQKEHFCEDCFLLRKLASKSISSVYETYPKAKKLIIEILELLYEKFRKRNFGEEVFIEKIMQEN